MKQRILYLEIIRVIAAIAVITIHVSSQYWAKVDLTSLDWQVMNLYDSLARVAVPLFVMISGALFLSREKPITYQDIFTKYIKRIAIIFIAWSFFYAFYYSLQRHESLSQFFIRFIGGHYHLWYLFMLIGLYLILPFLKKITEDKKMTEYFLILSFVFTSFIPTLVKIPGFNLLSEPYGSLHYHFTLGYPSYFVLGYYLHQAHFTKSAQKKIYFLGILGFLFTFISTAIMSLYKGVAYKGFYNNFMIGVVLEAVAIFVYVKHHDFHLSKTKLNLTNLFSKYSLGIYLIHVFVLDELKKIGIHTLMTTSLISIPLLIAFVFLVSATISAILNHLPIIKKYFV